MEENVIKIATDYWRLLALSAKIANNLEHTEKVKYSNQLRYFLKSIQNNLMECKLEIVNLEGQNFDTGMAATAINMDEFSPNDELIVEQMLEPLIMQNGVIKKQAVIKLAKRS